MAAFTQQLHGLQNNPRFDASLQTVLAAHVAVQGCQLGGLFRLSEQEDVILADADLPTGFAYVALGHIHKAQCLANQRHVRYSGSIERMDLGESRDEKGVVVFDLSPEGLRGDPEVLPIDATPVYEVTVHCPTEELPGLRESYPDAKRHLVKIVCTYTAGVDNREATLRELEEIFPRWYDRKITEKNDVVPPIKELPTKSFEATVRDYLTLELANEPDDLRDAVLARAEALMGEVQE